MLLTTSVLILLGAISVAKILTEVKDLDIGKAGHCFHYSNSLDETEKLRGW